MSKYRYIFQYRVRSWLEYKRALVQRCVEPVMRIMR
jgi:hypothetical protein